MNRMENVERRLAAVDRPVVAPGSARKAGVLVPLFVRAGMLWVVFTPPTDPAAHHRGQISFPGGAGEPGDGDRSATALRETEEALGVRPGDVKLLGKLSPMVTVTDFYVGPYVGALPQPYVFAPAETEIAEVVEASIGALQDPAIKETKFLPGRDEPVLFYRHGGQVSWGATARMLAGRPEVLG